LTEREYTDIEKLRLLLSHWLQHNESHGREYAKWAGVARQGGHTVATDCIEEVVALLAKADAAFTKALQSVGGPAGAHHYQQHD